MQCGVMQRPIIPPISSVHYCPGEYQSGSNGNVATFGGLVQGCLTQLVGQIDECLALTWLDLEVTEKRFND